MDEGNSFEMLQKTDGQTDRQVTIVPTIIIVVYICMVSATTKTTNILGRDLFVYAGIR